MPKTHDNIKAGRFSLIIELILAFTWSPNMVGEVKYLSPDFKQVPWHRFKPLNIVIRIVWSILSLNSKQFHQILF